MKHPSSKYTPRLWRSACIAAAITFLAFCLQSNAFATPALALVHTTTNSHFYCLNTINPKNKVIILVHGWSAIKSFDTSLQETRDYYEEQWQNFITHFQSENVCLHTWNVRNGLPYLDNNPLTDVLAKLHYQYQIPYKKINIISHSQGGNYSKDSLIKLYLQEKTEQLRDINLITMATPHTGSDRLYMRNVLKTAEVLGYTAAGIMYGVWLHSLYEDYKNAKTEEEKTEKQIMLGVSGTIGVLGAVFIGNRVSKFDEIYNYPGLLQLRALPENPVLRQINQRIRNYKLYRCISALYSDYGLISGDEVVPKNSGSWKGVQLKARKLLTGRSHLDFIKGDKEIFAWLNKIINS